MIDTEVCETTRTSSDRLAVGWMMMIFCQMIVNI